MHKDLYIKKYNPSMEEICSEKKWTYQKHQRFVKRWFEEDNKKLLLFHGLGSGKTCSAILTAKALLTKKVDNVYIVTPASLIQNFKNELLGKCGKYTKIPNNIHVYSYLKFLNAIEGNEQKLKKSLVVIDEVQNVVSSSGTIYKRMFNVLVSKKQDGMRVILLSGTPIFDQLNELALTLNLLDLPKPLPVKTFVSDFIDLRTSKLKDEEAFMKRIYPYVSSFKGVHPNAYAKKIEHIVKCPMTQFQEYGYKNSVEGKENAIFKSFSQSFFSGPRMASNLVYPDQSFGSKGREKYNDKKLKLQFTKENMKKYSTKFHNCMSVISKSVGPVFVYSNFVTAGGVNDFVIYLENMGFSNWNSNKKTDFKYGVFRSGEDELNKKLLSKYNDPRNKNGSRVKIIIGSPAMKEGISLKNTREVHILDPYWNNSRTMQIIGRAIRFCSHVQLETKERVVNVYHYISTIKGKTVDEHIHKIALKKQKLIDEINNALYKCSVDCHLFHNANGLKSTDCYKPNGKLKNDKLKNRKKLSFPLNGANENKENRLITLFKAQGVELKKGVKKEEFPLDLDVTIYSKNKTKQIKFEKYPILHKLISNIKYVNNEKNYAQIEIIPKKKYVYSSIKQNKKLKNIVMKDHNKKKKGFKQKFENKDECPKERSLVNNKCPNKKYPFKFKSKNGTPCCFSKPPKGSKGIFASEDKIYLNNKSIKGYTISKLKNIAKQYKNYNSSIKKKSNLFDFLKKKTY